MKTPRQQQNAIQDLAYDLYLADRYMKRANEAALHDGNPNPWMQFDILTNMGLAKNSKERAQRRERGMRVQDIQIGQRRAQAMIRTAENTGYLWTRGEIPSIGDELA